MLNAGIFQIKMLVFILFKILKLKSNSHFKTDQTKIK